MGTIQNSINGVLGAAAGAAALGKHISNQNTEFAANNAEDQQIIETAKTAIKNDTVEAATAIAAHEDDFRDILEKNNIDLDKVQEMSDEQIDDLTKKVDDFRSGKMTTDRIGIIKDKGKKLKENKGTENEEKYKSELKKAYESFRELNQRIDASRQLKFSLESAQARLKARGVK